MAHTAKISQKGKESEDALVEVCNPIPRRRRYAMMAIFVGMQSPYWPAVRGRPLDRLFDLGSLLPLWIYCVRPVCRPDRRAHQLILAQIRSPR